MFENSDPDGESGGKKRGEGKDRKEGGGGNCAAVKFLAKILLGSRPRNVKIVKGTLYPAHAMSK